MKKTLLLIFFCCVQSICPQQTYTQTRARLAGYNNEIDNIRLFNQQAIAQNPCNSKAHLALGYYFLEKNDVQQSQYHFSKTSQDFIELLRSRALMLKTQEQYEQANELYQEIIFQQPTWYNLFNYGCFAIGIGKIDAGIEAMHKSIALQFSLSAYHNIAYAHKIKGEFDKAIRLLKNILNTDPNNAGAHLTLANAYLNKGDFQQAYNANDWNLKHYDKDITPLKRLIETNQIAGKKVLLRCEGGLGDTIHYIRYAQRLKKLGAFVSAFVQPQLIPLFQQCYYIDTLITIGHQLPPFDVQASFMALPHAFNDRPETVTSHIPYIFPNEQLIKKWESVFDNKTINIGICWSANKHNDTSRLPIARRSIPLQKLQSIATINNVRLFSLQQHDGIEELPIIDTKNIQGSGQIHIFDENFDKKPGAFMDTAAVMMHLDLIISVDTAIAHLAGALGKPVWLLLPYCTDPRWTFGHAYSPWYPTMRIFKQPEPFDWDRVMQQIKDELLLVVENI